MLQNFSYLQKLPKVPRDPEDGRFVISFQVEQKQELKAFFEEFGFVVVRDVVGREDCAKTIDEIWDYIESKGWGKAPISRKDMSTWKNENWPGMKEEGIVGTASIFLPQALKNRQNRKLYEVYATLLGRKDLLVNHDRYGFFRPTEGLPEARKEWKTMRNLHFDMNAWYFVDGGEKEEQHAKNVLDSLRYLRMADFIEENNEVGTLATYELNIQGLINLVDNNEEDGGFHLLPGFHHYLKEFTDLTPSLKKQYGPYSRFIILPRDLPIHKHALRITARAGSIILWDQRVPHGSAPNNSPNPRFAQFIKVFPAFENEERFQGRRKAVLGKIKDAGFLRNVTPLGNFLFGLERWRDLDWEEQERKEKEIQEMEAGRE